MSAESSGGNAGGRGGGGGEQGSSRFPLVLAGRRITQPLFGEELIDRETLSKENKQGPLSMRLLKRNA